MKQIVAAAGLSFFTAHSVAATIKIENESSREIREIYLAPSIEGSWGDDRLEDEVLAPGKYLTLTGVTPGEWDFRVIGEGKDECVLKNQEISSSTSFFFSGDNFASCMQETQR